MFRFKNNDLMHSHCFNDKVRTGIERVSVRRLKLSKVGEMRVFVRETEAEKETNQKGRKKY